jgi:hypothetical protein
MRETKLPEPGRWRYYCTCGWKTPWRDRSKGQEYPVDRAEALAHFGLMK